MAIDFLASLCAPGQSFVKRLVRNRRLQILIAGGILQQLATELPG